MALVPADSGYPTNPNARFQSPVGGNPRGRVPFAARRDLVERLTRQLTRDSAPRFHLLTILLLAGGAAFLAATGFLWSDIRALETMTVRYPAAALCGYLSFIGLIRIWIALHRDPPESGPDMDLVEDVVDTVWPDSSLREVEIIEGVRPSGNGAFRGAVRSQFQETGGHSSADWGIDFDELIWVVFAGACAVGGLAAIAYVIYIAPVLLAEVALDAAIVSALYRRLREEETGHWLTTVVTRTWVPALVVVIFAGLAGFALEQFVPEARSIGGVFRAWSP